MCVDILNKMRNGTGNLHSQFTEEINNEASISIDDIFLRMPKKV